MIDNFERLNIIKCPTCGAEYLPVEIFIPDAFFGSPIHIERDADHKIIDVIGDAGLQTEQYICNYCKVPFRVTTRLQHAVKAETKFNFDDEYTTILKKESLFLNED